MLIFLMFHAFHTFMTMARNHNTIVTTGGTPVTLCHFVSNGSLHRNFTRTLWYFATLSWLFSLSHFTKCLFCQCAAQAFSWVGSCYLTLENCSPSCCVCFAKLVPIHLSVLGFTQMNTQALPRLRQVVYIHDRTSSQSFFVNTTLLHQEKPKMLVTL